MTIDTRTPAEIEYDRLALSTRPIGALPDTPAVAAQEVPGAAEQIEAIWEAGEMPSGNLIVDLLNEDELANYVWWRCIDWVLWRQRNGLPVERMNKKDDCPAEIEARFTAERRSSAREHRGDFCAGITTRRGTLEKWERGAQQHTQEASQAITVDTWQDEGAEYIDFEIGEGLTKVTIGTYDDQKQGVELIIGGTGINECLAEIITLADVRVLRDNLSTLLDDAGVQMTWAEPMKQAA